MKLIKILTAFIALVSLQIAAAQWLHVPPPVEARMLPIYGGRAAAGGADYAATKASIYLRADGGSHVNFKISLYNSSGNRLADSAEGTTVNSNGVIEVAISYTLSTAGTYYIGLSCSTYIGVFFDSAANQESYVVITYPTTAADFSTADTHNRGNMAIWLSNASNQTIVGDSNTADKTTESNNGGENLTTYKTAGYTRNTL